MGHVLSFRGEFVPARIHFEQSLSFYSPQEHSTHSAIYGQDPGPVCLCRLGHDLWYLGYPDQSLNQAQAALSLGQGSAHSFTRASVIGGVAWLHQLRREGAATQEWAEATITLCVEQELPFFLAGAMIWHGWALAKKGHVDEGIGHISQGLDNYRDLGVRWGRSYFLALLAEAYGCGLQTDRALHAIAEGLALAVEMGERWHQAELYRLKGELTLDRLQTVDHKSHESLEASSIHVEAQACFQKAIEVAREQSAKSLELRATTSLARLLRDSGRRDQARGMLAEIYHWFTEGFDTIDLKEAKALLNELSV